MLLSEPRHGGHPDQKVHGRRGTGGATGPGSGFRTRWTINGAGDYEPIGRDADGNPFRGTTPADLKRLGAIEVSANMTPEQKATLESELTMTLSESAMADFNEVSPAVKNFADDAARDASELGIDLGSIEEMPLGVALQAAQIAKQANAGNLEYEAGQKLDAAIRKLETDHDYEAFSNELTTQLGVDQAAGFAGAVNRSWQQSASDPVSTAMMLRRSEGAADVIELDVWDGYSWSQATDRSITKTVIVPRSLGWRASGDMVDAADLSTAFKGSFDAVSSATAAHTKAVFEAQGVTELTLYRGVKGKMTDRIGDSIDTAPLSSWTTNPDIARSFGSETAFGETMTNSGVVVRATVPVSDVFTTARFTGMGSDHEEEFIVSGGAPRPAEIVTRSAAGDAIYEDGTVNLDHPDFGGPDWIKHVPGAGEEQERTMRQGVQVDLGAKYGEELDAGCCEECRHPGHPDQKVHGRKGKGGLKTTGTGTKDDPIKTNDVKAAAAALGEGKHVELNHEREVSTLLDELTATVNDAKAKGEKAPDYDLCKVSVTGTNLFCVQSKGVPRVRMPQLSGVPVKGSKADQLPKNDKGEVDLGPAFIEHLASRGISTSPDKVPAEVLRASQNQLDGRKVAGMANAKSLPPGSIFVTKDDYVVDGHHRWAAKVANGTRGIDSDIDVKVIDADIIPVLAMANNFTTSMGIPHAAVHSAFTIAMTTRAGDLVFALDGPAARGPDGLPSRAVRRYVRDWRPGGGDVAPFVDAVRHPGHADQKVHGRKGAGRTAGLAAPDGGFTADVNGRAITSGWAVAMAGSSSFMSAEEFSGDRNARKEFVASYFKEARGQGVTAIGGWHDPAPSDPGKAIVLDHVRVFPPGERSAAVAFGQANNQKAITNLDAVTAGDWDNAFVDTGGTGDRGSIPAHGEDTAHHGRVPEASGRHDRRGDRRAGGRGGGRNGREPGFVDLAAKYGLILRHPGHADQKVHGRRGTLTAWEGMESVGPKTGAAITKTIETAWGMPEPEARALAIDNLVKAAQRGNPADADWYFKEHDEMQMLADKNGTSLETMVAMTSVTSAQMPWGRNKKIADGIAGKLKADEEFELTQERLDDYNAWVGNRKAGLAQAHPDIKPGRYKPSDLPSDLAASVTPGMPKLKNTDYAVAAVNVYRGESPDSVIHGPKQRSFFNNLVAPGDGRYVTADTWHYDAMGGDHEFPRTVKGETSSHTIPEWRDQGNVTSGVTPKQVTPQDIFQSSPTVKSENYPSNNGVYPWSVGVTKAATAQYNAANGTDLNPSQFQALVWVSVGGGT